MDAAQAEKMREREAMESVKLLYHDNMIEMTSVSSSKSSWSTLAQGRNTQHDSELAGVIIYVVLTFKNYHMSLSFINTDISIVLYHKHLSISEKHEPRCYVVLFLCVVD